MNEIVESKFVMPAPKAELDGELGLSVEEIARSLGSQVKSVRRKLLKDGFLEMMTKHGFSWAPISTLNKNNGLNYTDYILSVGAAKVFVAGWGNQIGEEYRIYLVKLDESFEKAQSTRLSKRTLLRQMFEVIDENAERIDSIESDINTLKEETPKLVEKKVEEALSRPDEFPADCLRLSDIATTYFPGVAKAKVADYLRKTRHKRGTVVSTDELGLRFTSHPYKIEGLDTAAERYFRERTLRKETAKIRVWHHRLVGDHHERIIPKMGDQTGGA